MSSFRLTTFCFFSISIFAGLNPATAVAAPVCQTGSFSSYIALDGAGCTIGQFTFFDFNDPLPTTVGSPTIADTSQIFVTPMSSGTEAGFTFTASSGSTNLFTLTSPSGTTSITYHIDYSVDPAPIILGGGLSLDPPYGNASATQTYCTSDVLPGCTNGTLSQQTVTVANPISTISFANPASFVDIATNVSLVATPGDPAGLDAVTAFVDTGTATPTPEPATLLLTASAFVVVSLVRRKRA